MLSAFDLWILILETRTLWVLIVGNVRLTEVNFTCTCGSLWFSDSAVCWESTVTEPKWHGAVTTGEAFCPADEVYTAVWNKMTHKNVPQLQCSMSVDFLLLLGKKIPNSGIKFLGKVRKKAAFKLWDCRSAFWGSLHLIAICLTG